MCKKVVGSYGDSSYDYALTADVWWLNDACLELADR
jgi:hypothetical protein